MFSQTHTSHVCISECHEIYTDKSSDDIRKLISKYESDPNIRFALKSRLNVSTQVVPK